MLLTCDVSGSFVRIYDASMVGRNGKSNLLLILSQGTSMSPFWLKTSLQQFFPARLPPVLPLGSQSRSSTGRNCCCKAMAGQMQPTFQALLTECNVPTAFQEWLVANTMVDRAKFLLGARNTSTLNLPASILTASHWHKRV